MAVDHGLMRLHASLHRAAVGALARQDVSEPVALARLACVVPDGDDHHDLHLAIRNSLDRIDPTATRGIARPLIVLAAASLTPDAPVPDLRT